MTASVASLIFALVVVGLVCLRRRREVATPTTEEKKNARILKEIERWRTGL